MSEPVASEKPRRYRGVGLRLFLTIIALVGIALGWWSYRARLQRDAVAAIKRADGYVVYDWEENRELYPYPAQPKPRWPEWLRRALGPDYLETVVEVELIGNPGTPKQSDQILEQIARLSHLKTLNVTGVAVTDAGVARIEELRELRELVIFSPHVTDDGIRYLNKLVSLNVLGLCETRATSAGLSRVSIISNLRTLYVDKSAISDLAVVRHSNRLAVLSARDTPIDDEGLAAIGTVPNLAWLDLTGTKVTDAALDHLRGCLQLENLYLFETNVSAAGIARLRSVLPKLQVDADVSSP
jgi:hypothetical protein